MIKTLGRCGSRVWIELKHGREKISELARLVLRPFVFFGQHLVQTPWFETCNVLELTFFVKKGTRVTTRESYAPWDLTQQLDYVGQVVFVPKKINKRLIKCSLNQCNKLKFYRYIKKKDLKFWFLCHAYFRNNVFFFFFLN